MTPRCTCGAYLPEDARFCHKCGKPQFEEDIARMAADEAPVQPSMAVAQDVAILSSAASKISFKNSRAVIISLIVAAGAFICSGAAALVSPILSPVVLMAAGFMAAILYRSGSQQPLSTAAGARLGWMTGLWLFVVFVLVAAIVSIYLSSPAGGDVIKQIQSMPQFNNMAISNPHDLVMNCLVSAIPTFFMVTLLPGLGGIIGARLSRGRNSA